MLNEKKLIKILNTKKKSFEDMKKIWVIFIYCIMKCISTTQKFKHAIPAAIDLFMS